MSALPNPLLTAQQYLEVERKAASKSEFLDGEMFAMAGASYAHNRLVARLSGILYRQLRPPCENLPSDMRVFIPATGLYTYPDLTVVCGKPHFADESVDTLLNPSVVIEVLSPSTESYDRGLKFEYYSSSPTLNTYVLVASDRAHVDVYTRQPDSKWLRSSANAGEEIPITSICCHLPLVELYDNIKFD